ncbi:MAG: NAD-dependent epimerase/dehydratase family protein [Alphaproteobacteria bacterium]|nr:NAD-dependent epimerase/dehydratase family protein [Alphaproteobacteria bacterium]
MMASRPAMLVTGATGYIGTALTAALSAASCIVRTLSRADFSAGLKADSFADVDTVFHLSAQTNLRFAEQHPAEDERANVAPLEGLLKVVRPGTRVVLASTVTIAGLASRIDHRTPDAPISVYDRHKLAAERILHGATAAGHVRGIGLRLANVYGFGNQSRNTERSVLNLMMRRALAQQPLTLYGDGAYVRDFIHLSDVVAALVAAGSADAPVGSFPIGSGTGTTLAACFALVANEAERLTGRPVSITRVPEPADLHAIERRNAIVDPAAFRAATGWRPRTSLRDGIRGDLARFSAAAALSDVAGTAVASAPLDRAALKGAIAP